MKVYLAYRYTGISEVLTNLPMIPDEPTFVKCITAISWPDGQKTQTTTTVTTKIQLASILNVTSVGISIKNSRRSASLCFKPIKRAHSHTATAERNPVCYISVMLDRSPAIKAWRRRRQADNKREREGWLMEAGPEGAGSAGWSGWWRGCSLSYILSFFMSDKCHKRWAKTKEANKTNKKKKRPTGWHPSPASKKPVCVTQSWYMRLFKTTSCRHSCKSPESARRIFHRLINVRRYELVLTKHRPRVPSAYVPW